MEVSGILKVKKETNPVSEKFKNREFVLTTESDGKYPQHISFQLTQDKCSLIDNYSIGDTVKVHFNLRGREWTSPQGEVKYFNTLEAWRLEKEGASQSAPAQSTSTPAAPAKQAAAATTPQNPTFVASTGDDDLPF